MKSIFVDDKPYGIDMFKKILELNFPGIDIETAYANNISARQKHERINNDTVYRTERKSSDPSASKADFPLGTRLCLPTQKGFTIIKLEEIIYCEAQRSYTQFHLLSNKSITVSRPLFDYDRLLNDSTFLRVHKSFLINLLHVKEYTRGEGGTIIMSNNMEIEVSRRKKEQFLNKIKESFKY